MGYSLLHTGRLRVLPRSDLVSADLEPKQPIRTTVAFQSSGPKSTARAAVSPSRRPCSTATSEVVSEENGYETTDPRRQVDEPV